MRELNGVSSIALLDYQRAILIARVCFNVWMYKATHWASLQVTFHNGRCCPDIFENMKQRAPGRSFLGKVIFLRFWPPLSSNRSESLENVSRATQNIHTSSCFFLYQMKRSQPVALQTLDFGMSLGRGSFQESWFSACTAVNLRKSGIHLHEVAGSPPSCDAALWPQHSVNHSRIG